MVRDSVRVSLSLPCVFKPVFTPRLFVSSFVFCLLFSCAFSSVHVCPLRSFIELHCFLFVLCFVLLSLVFMCFGMFWIDLAWKGFYVKVGLCVAITIWDDFNTKGNFVQSLFSKHLFFSLELDFVLPYTTKETKQAVCMSLSTYLTIKSSKTVKVDTS